MRWPVRSLLERYLLSGRPAEEARKDEADPTAWMSMGGGLALRFCFPKSALAGAPSSRLIEELPSVRFDVL